MFHLSFEVYKNVSFKHSITFFLLTPLNITLIVGLNEIYFKLLGLNETY